MTDLFIAMFMGLLGKIVQFENNFKPLGKTFSGSWDQLAVRSQLQKYLALGLVPIPLNGKVPTVKWHHGWNPKSMASK